MDGGLTVTEALNRGGTGVIAVQGFLFDHGSGPKPSDAWAESFPHQCGGASIPISGQVGSSDVSVGARAGCHLDRSAVTVFGDIINGNFVVDSTVSG
ncbi:MAG: hypothetical protein OEM40_06080 [Acidimicrobiia bacterium]|nr:hypothetical protein [Acidimicrobiia bacterium]